MVKRCFACMNPTDTLICPKCGFDSSNTNTKENAPLFLPPETVIKERYYIGMPIEQNGEGVTYMGYDTLQNERVRIREFFPDTLCHRKGNGNDVFCNLGMEIQYKSLMTDFIELSKQLISITANSCLLKAKEILSDNNTIYTVYEDCVGVKLTKYLRDNAGELSWEETENLFLPLLYTVKLLNSNGIIHRGISPETIIVTKSRELKLSGVCTSAVRAINSEVRSELFAGYAAPEQYQKCTSHGEWTDVYSISAVLYKTLTGTMPQSADVRDPSDAVICPRQLNSSIAKGVSDAIVNGLGYNKDDRTLYVKDLIGELYAAPQSPTAINIHSQQSDEDLKPRKKFRVPVWLIVILVTLPIMLILFFVAYNFVLGGDSGTSSSAPSSDLSQTPSSEVSSAPPSSAEPEVPMIVVEDFVGKDYDEIVKDVLYTKMFTFKKVEKYDETISIGEVIEQAVEKNEVVKQGTEIELTVSKGMQFVTIPPTVDEAGLAIPLEDYKRYLTDNGFEVKLEHITSVLTNPGDIDKVSENVGTAVDREKVKTITIYVADTNSGVSSQDSDTASESFE